MKKKVSKKLLNKEKQGEKPCAAQVFFLMNEDVLH